MIVRNDSNALTEVHFDGKSEKQVFVGNNLVWSTMDWNKYSFKIITYPNSNREDYTASRNIDGITSMGIQNKHLGDFIEITPSTKISAEDMKRINYKAGESALHIYYTGNYISANMFDETMKDASTDFNDLNHDALIIYKNLDYIGDNAFKNDGDVESHVDGHGISHIIFGKNVTKVPLLSPTALPKYFLPEGEINVPQSLEEAFKNADVWKNYADIINCRNWMTEDD